MPSWLSFLSSTKGAKFSLQVPGSLSEETVEKTGKGERAKEKKTREKKTETGQLNFTLLARLLDCPQMTRNLKLRIRWAIIGEHNNIDKLCSHCEFLVSRKPQKLFEPVKPFFSSHVSKNREVYTPETACMKVTSLYIKNM